MKSEKLFSSARERRLWTWTLVVVITIYSTLGLARTLSGILRENDILGQAFFYGFILIGIAVIVLALRVRPGGVEIGIGIGIAAVYLMLFSRLGLLEERTHLFEYSFLAVLIYEALKERASQGRRVPSPPVLAFFITVGIGWLDEGIQAILPNRFYDIIDVGFNSLAAFVAIVGSLALEWARRWRRPKSK